MKPLTILAGLLCGVSPAAWAQTAPPDQPARPAEQVDTSALAYYATHHDTARMDAEMRRLRTLYPNWQPPADPTALAVSSGDADIKPLWDLFGADKLDELDAEIAARKAADPAFAPPEDLVRKLADKRSRQALLAASDKHDFGAVIDIASRSPGVAEVADLDVNWRLAEAYGRSGAIDKALALDETILDATQDPAARLATVRKAMAALPADDVRRLLSKGRTGPDGRSEFAAVDIDLVRQRVGRVLAGTSTETPAPQDLGQLEVSARAGAATDAALLGWLSAKRQQWPDASTWFQLAMAHGPAPAQAKPEDAKLAQGAVMALKALGRGAGAEMLAYQWHEADPALALLYIGSVLADLTRPRPVAIDADRLRRFSDLVVKDQSGDGAQALGWYAYNIGQFRPAQAWFVKALAWQPRDSTALGLALSLKQIGDRPALAVFLKDNGPTFPALASLSSAPMPLKRHPSDQATADPEPAPSGEPRAIRAGPVRHAHAGRRARTVTARKDRSGAGGCSDGGGSLIDQGRPAAALRAGWCLMSLDRPREAAMAFAAAQAGTETRSDATYGKALADLRSRRTDAAVTTANAGPLTPERRTEIGLSALAQSASSSFDQGRYDATLQALDRRRMFGAEARDLQVLRAWSAYHLGRREEAHEIFSTLDQQLSTSETRVGLGTTELQTGK